MSLERDPLTYEKIAFDSSNFETDMILLEYYCFWPLVFKRAEGRIGKGRYR